MATLFLSSWGTSILFFPLFNCKCNKKLWFYWLPSDCLSAVAQFSRSGCNYPHPTPHLPSRGSKPKQSNWLVTSRRQTSDSPGLTVASSLLCKSTTTTTTTVKTPTGSHSIPGSALAPVTHSPEERLFPQLWNNPSFTALSCHSAIDFKPITETWLNSPRHDLFYC